MRCLRFERIPNIRQITERRNIDNPAIRIANHQESLMVKLAAVQAKPKTAKPAPKGTRGEFFSTYSLNPAMTIFWSFPFYLERLFYIQSVNEISYRPIKRKWTPNRGIIRPHGCPTINRCTFLWAPSDLCHAFPTRPTQRPQRGRFPLADSNIHQTSRFAIPPERQTDYLSLFHKNLSQFSFFTTIS